VNERLHVPILLPLGRVIGTHWIGLWASTSVGPDVLRKEEFLTVWNRTQTTHVHKVPGTRKYGTIHPLHHTSHDTDLSSEREPFHLYLKIMLEDIFTTTSVKKKAFFWYFTTCGSCENRVPIASKLMYACSTYYNAYAHICVILFKPHRMKYGFLYAHSLQIFFKNREFLS
jgi:hypothetical protein